MQNTTPVMDREEVERIAYQAIGQQFRLPSLFAMLLLLVGFVLGHYVAARHTGVIADRFEQRITDLQEKLAALESAKPRVLPAPVSSVIMPAEDIALHDASETSPFDASTTTFRLAGMARTFDSPVTDFAMLSGAVLADVDPLATASRDAIEHLRLAAAEERDACLTELAPYLERRLSVPATTVVQVVETIYADQDRRLAAAMNDATGKAAGLDPRDTSVKIFPPMSDETGPAAGPLADDSAPLGYRYFPKPSAPKSMFFSPMGNRVPAPATSAIDTDFIIR